MAIKSVAKKRYHIYLDYSGYMIDPQSFNKQEAPLFGNKFSSGEPSYATLDFWQQSGNTDWQRGHGQKFHVDPARFQDSYNLEVQEVPGEITLARKPVSLGVALGVEITAYLVDQEAGSGTPQIYLGTSNGKIYSANLPLTEMPTLEKDTLTGKKITEIFRYGSDIYALIPTGSAWRKNALVWATTDIVNWNKATVWGSYCYGAFDDAGGGSYREVKFCTDPSTQTFWTAATTAFVLPTKDISINKLLFAHERLYIGTYIRLLGWDGGGDPWQLYDFSFVPHANNFRDMVLADNYVWFPIYKLGIFYTNGATIAATTITIDDNDFFPIHRCFSVGQNGPTIWASYFSKDESGNGIGASNKLTDTSFNWIVNEWVGYYLCDCLDNFYAIISNTATELVVSGTPGSGDYVIGKYWLAKSKIRNYFFTYCELLTDCLLPSYATDLYQAYKTGAVNKINKSCSYQTSGRLYSSRFDANLINLEKLVRNITVYHEPLATGESVKVAANFDEQYTKNQFSSWDDTSHIYAAADTNPGFEAIFSGNQESGKQSYEGGRRAQRFQYGIELTGNGLTTPKVQDIFWKYYLETPLSEDAVKWQWQFAIPISDEVEKLDDEVIDTYYSEARTGHKLVSDLEATRLKKQIINFVAPDHILSSAFRLFYKGASAYAYLTIDQVNKRLGVKTSVTDDNLDLDLSNALYDTLGELVAYLNGLTNYDCTIDSEASSATLSSLLLPVYEINIVGVSGSAGKLFYTVDKIYNIIITAYRRRDMFISALENNENAIVYLVLREV